MSFLAPLFLLGAAAVTLPIVFHLIRRATRERKPFSSLMFLLESPPRLTRRSRLEHLLLLLLRCLALGLLAFGFARPFIRQAMTAPNDGPARRILILLDTSASMKRSGLWADAQKSVARIAESAGLADQVALSTFDREVQPRLSFQEWTAQPAGERTALLSRKLAEVSPGWGATQLGNALVHATELLADGSAAPVDGASQIELITDLQEGSHLEQIQGFEWPKGVRVSVHILKPRSSNNAAVQLVTESDNSEASTAGTARVRVSNVAGARREQFKIGWGTRDSAGLAGPATQVYVPAGQSRVVTVAAAPTGAPDRVVLQGDDEDFDNVVFVKPAAPFKSSVIYIGNDAETDPKQGLYFLKRAFQKTRSQQVNISSFRPSDLIPAALAESSRLFILTAPPAESSLGALRQQVESGKTFLVVASSAAMLPALRHLLQVQDLAFQEQRPANYAMLSEIDFQHPLFAPFSDPRYNDFTKIHFWTYGRIDPAAIPRARVVARFDTGDPALLEVPSGAGRVLVLTSGWQPEASQLALSSKFVPLMYSILETSGGSFSAPPQFHVGDAVPLTPWLGAQPAGAIVGLPDGSERAVAAGETSFSRTDLPGVYTLKSAETTNNFVVNLDPAESRTVPASVEDLEKLGVPIVNVVTPGAPAAERKLHFQNAELENRQKLWRWFILGTMMVLLVESWLSGRTARKAVGSLAAG